MVAQQDGNEWIVYDIFGEFKESVVTERDGREHAAQLFVTALSGLWKREYTENTAGLYASG